MDLNGIYPNAGTIFEEGYSKLTWNPNGTLQMKELWVDAGMTELIYRKTFTWNPDGTLASWELLNATTGETTTKTFNWSLGVLQGSTV